MPVYIGFLNLVFAPFEDDLYPLVVAALPYFFRVLLVFKEFKDGPLYSLIGLNGYEVKSLSFKVMGYSD